MSADHHYLTISRAHFSTHWGHVFFYVFKWWLFDHGLNSKPHSIENLSSLKNLAITWPDTDHPIFRPYAPQAHQCLISHFPTSWEPATWYCTSMFWLIDSHQNSVSADKHRLTVSPAQVSTHWLRVLFWSYPLTSCYFSNDHRLKFNFFKCIWNNSCLWAVLLKFWFQTDLGRENSTGFIIHAGKAIAFDFSHHNHALITLYVQCSDWSKFDRWVHVENLCSVWKLAYW